MFNVGGGEFLIILLVALVVLGPTRLPDAARQVGKVMGEFRRMSANFQREMQSAMNDPISKVTGQETPKSLTDVTQTAVPPANLDDVPLSETPETLQEATNFTPRDKLKASADNAEVDRDDDTPSGPRETPDDDNPQEVPMFGDR